MTTFDDRKQQFEAKYSRDQQLQFKVKARRNRLLGEWAGAQMGLSGDALADYARAVVEADFEKPGDDDVLQKVLGDLTAKGVDCNEHRLRRQMDELLATAKQQVMAE
jgi:hypothetical protein